MADDFPYPQEAAKEPAEEQAAEDDNGISWVEFIASTPPGVEVLVFDLSHQRPLADPRGGAQRIMQWAVNSTSVQLFCESVECAGTRYFSITLDLMGQLRPDSDEIGFLKYQCRNCGKYRKLYALRLTRREEDEDNEVIPGYLSGAAFKLGESPNFGIRMPRRIQDLIKDKDDLELFRQGLKAESNGLGIGAFIYYRRVVENEKDRLFQRIIDVAKRTNSPPAVVETLEAALEEKQFKRAVDMVKDGIPDVFFIDGHNPLTSLHQALSTAVHEKSDAECMELAKTVRLVLTELADRAAAALREHKDLTQALAKLHKAKK